MTHALLLRTAAALIAMTLAACTGPLSDGPNATVAAVQDAFSDIPFADGQVVSVIANDPDPLRTIDTYTLVPCQEGRAVCSGSSTGSAGALTLEDGIYVVRGAYGNRVFYLNKGGDGFMQEGNLLKPIAWN